jgi:phage head maturation protease
VQGHQIELRRDAYLVGSNHHAGTIYGKTASSELIQSFDTCSLEMTPTSIPEGTNRIVSVNHNIVYGCLNSCLIGHNLEEGKTWWIDKVSGVLNIDFFNEHTLLGVPNANHSDIDWYASYLQVDIETGSVRRLRTF